MTRKQLQNAFTRMLWDADLIGSRATLALAEMLWAVMLWWPGDTFSRPTYTHIAVVMPEDAWGLVFALSSVTQLSIIVQNDFHSRFARYFAGWNFALWAFVVISMLLSVYPPPAAIAGEIALMFSAWWIWSRPYLLMMAMMEDGYDVAPKK